MSLAGTTVAVGLVVEVFGFFGWKLGQAVAFLWIVNSAPLLPESPIRTRIYVARDLMLVSHGISKVTVPAVRSKPVASGVENRCSSGVVSFLSR